MASAIVELVTSMRIETNVSVLTGLWQVLGERTVKGTPSAEKWALKLDRNGWKQFAEKEVFVLYPV